MKKVLLYLFIPFFAIIALALDMDFYNGWSFRGVKEDTKISEILKIDGVLGVFPFDKESNEFVRYLADSDGDTTEIIKAGEGFLVYYNGALTTQKIDLKLGWNLKSAIHDTRISEFFANENILAILYYDTLNSEYITFDSTSDKESNYILKATEAFWVYCNLDSCEVDVKPYGVKVQSSSTSSSSSILSSSSNISSSSLSSSSLSSLSSSSISLSSSSSSSELSSSSSTTSTSSSSDANSSSSSPYVLIEDENWYADGNGGQEMCEQYSGYLVINGENNMTSCKMNWSNASKYCQAMGGSLPTLSALSNSYSYCIAYNEYMDGSKCIPNGFAFEGDYWVNQSAGDSDDFMDYGFDGLGSGWAAMTAFNYTRCHK